MAVSPFADPMQEAVRRKIELFRILRLSRIDAPQKKVRQAPTARPDRPDL